MIRQITVQITAPVYDTEQVDRVEAAITALFPQADIEHSEGELIGTTHSLTEFATKLREQKILDTAREQLLANRRGSTIAVHLKKQAALQGVVTFAVGEPDELGELAVHIHVEQPDVETYIDYIAPATTGDEPIPELEEQ